MEKNIKNTRYIPLAEWDQYHPWPTPGAFRQYRYKSGVNGMDKLGVIVKVGRKLLVDEQAFFRWVKTHKKLPN